MAEFDKMLRALDPEGIRAAAEFLLEQLYPLEKTAERTAGAGLAGPDNEGKVGITSAAELIAGAERRLEFMEARAEKRLQETVEALPRMISDARASEYEAAVVDREILNADLTARRESYERMHSAYGTAELGLAPGAAELSDFFRRDSRRYDKEFERY